MVSMVVLAYMLLFNIKSTNFVYNIINGIFQNLPVLWVLSPHILHHTAQDTGHTCPNVPTTQASPVHSVIDHTHEWATPYIQVGGFVE